MLEWQYVKLRDHHQWRPFHLAGAAPHDGTRADFSVVSSVVFHFGTASDRSDLNPGKGTVEIGEIRFAQNNNLPIS